MAYQIIFDNIAYPGKGQDYVMTDLHPWQEPAVGVLADGISSARYAGLAAKAACEEAFKPLAETGINVQDKAFYQALYDRVTCALDVLAGGTEAEITAGLATTLITAVAGDGCARFSYCGNGAIFHIRPHWFDLPDELLLPWGVNNYLNPHTLFLDGDNKLYKSLKPAQDRARRSPDIVSFEYTDGTAPYFLVCSDGLYTSDESLPLWDEAQANIYHSENQRFLLFLRLLRLHHAKQWENRDNFVRDFRAEIDARGLLSDDLSYMLFIPA